MPAVVVYDVAATLACLRTRVTVSVPRAVKTVFPGRSPKTEFSVRVPVVKPEDPTPSSPLPCPLPCRVREDESPGDRERLLPRRLDDDMSSSTTPCKQQLRHGDPPSSPFVFCVGRLRACP